MNPQHTPGPWRTTPPQEMFGWEVETKDGHLICKMPYGPFDQEVREANARLIAAAPDMLEALKSLLADGDHGTGEEFFYCKWCGHELRPVLGAYPLDWHDCDRSDCNGVKAKKTIAKARGE